jgi:rhodanese-related sulfurtransferase
VPVLLEGVNMKPHFWAGLLAGLLLLVPAISARSPQSSQKDSNSATKSDPGSSQSSKDAEPLPQVPRITAEEVEPLLKEKKVVIVDTDDPEAYKAEHIAGAVNIAYDPTVDAREQDQSLSALPGDRMIVFYCNCAHEEDSAPMVLEMWELGYDHAKVKALRGGLTRWEQLKYPLAGTDVNPTEEKGN